MTLQDLKSTTRTVILVINLTLITLLAGKVLFCLDSPHLLAFYGIMTTAVILMVFGIVFVWYRDPWETAREKFRDLPEGRRHTTANTGDLPAGGRCASAGSGDLPAGGRCASAGSGDLPAGG
ncbi:MAG: hypothetical protein KA419_03045, partial [Acidobacteria bacterium]|nr:hypothetical protein [Acidobacteriota bacterium]